MALRLVRCIHIQVEGKGEVKDQIEGEEGRVASICPVKRCEGGSYSRKPHDRTMVVPSKANKDLTGVGLEGAGMSDIAWRREGLGRCCDGKQYGQERECYLWLGYIYQLA